MIVTIHQPEYLPYIGFFERIALSDVFVILNDVGYQKNGFVNRNKIKTKKGPKWITVPVRGRSSNLKINEVLIDNNKDWGKSQWGSIVEAYGKAPYFKNYSEFFKSTLKREWNSISELDIYLIDNISKFLGIKSKIVKSSDLNVSGMGTERLINICKGLKADNYLSGFGNEKHSVEKEKFEKEGIKVYIKEFGNPQYSQLYSGLGFLSRLSIIDLLFNEGLRSLEIIKLGSKKNNI